MKRKGVINSWFKSSARSAVSSTYHVEVFRLPAHDQILQTIIKAIHDWKPTSKGSRLDRALR
jgi:hypothetical protein